MSQALWPKRAGIYMRPGKIDAPTWAGLPIPGTTVTKMKDERTRYQAQTHFLHGAKTRVLTILWVQFTD